MAAEHHSTLPNALHDRGSITARAAHPLREAMPRHLCTDCGISRTAEPDRCGRACQFIRPDYARLEQAVHGRARDASRPDELHFGPFRRMVRASLSPASPGAQWTGIATRIGENLLATGRVDAVLTVAPDPADRWRPVPVLVTRPEDMAQVRGMRMGYAPLLALLEPARAQGIRRLAVIGIPCQVYALRALEAELGFERIYVIGTPCSDNTTTENFHKFLALLAPDPESVTYLEFRADFMVELRFKNGRKQEIPFLQLPISQLLVRNERGEEMLGLLGDELIASTPRSKGKRRRHVQGFLQNTVRAAGGLPLRRMPRFLRPLVSWLMPRTASPQVNDTGTRVGTRRRVWTAARRRRAPRLS